MSSGYVPLEEVFSSKGRVKVLKVLLEAHELNITEIVKRSELNHTVVLSHLEALVKAGLVIEKRFGRIRIFRINESDPRIKLLRELFKLDEELCKASTPSEGT